MKTTAIILGALLVLFFGLQIYSYMSNRSIEKYAYTVLKEYDGFEIRNYEASLFTSVKLKTDSYNDASGKGFSILGGYFFGKNEKKVSIAMTSPVAMSLEKETTMMFLVPKAYNKETLPKPENDAIQFVQIPAKKMAAITFGGWANDKKIAKYKKKLIKLLDQNEIKYTNNFSVLGYNPPHEVLIRRNEITVELK
jgi:transcription initiation factor IIF auxiliary subunit